MMNALSFGFQYWRVSVLLVALLSVVQAQHTSTPLTLPQLPQLTYETTNEATHKRAALWQQASELVQQHDNEAALALYSEILVLDDQAGFPLSPALERIITLQLIRLNDEVEAQAYVSVLQRRAAQLSPFILELEISDFSASEVQAYFTFLLKEAEKRHDDWLKARALSALSALWESYPELTTPEKQWQMAFDAQVSALARDNPVVTEALGVRLSSLAGYQEAAQLRQVYKEALAQEDVWAQVAGLTQRLERTPNPAMLPLGQTLWITLSPLLKTDAQALIPILERAGATLLRADEASAEHNDLTEKFYKALLAEVVRVGDSHKHINALANLAATYAKQGHPNKQERILKEQLILAQVLEGRGEVLVWGLSSLSIHEQLTRLYRDNLHNTPQALRSYIDYARAAAAQGQSVFDPWGDDLSQRGFYKRVLETASSRTVIWARLHALYMLAQIHADALETKEAQDYYEQLLGTGIVHAQDTGLADMFIFEIMRNLALLHDQTGDVVQGAELYGAWLGWANALGAYEQELIAWESLAQLYLSLGQYEDSIQSYQQLLLQAEQVGHEVYQQQALSNLAFITHTYLERPEEAKDYYETLVAKLMAQPDPDMNSLLFTLMRLAELDLERNDPQSAKEHYEQVITLSAQVFADPKAAALLHSDFDTEAFMNLSRLQQAGEVPGDAYETLEHWLTQTIATERPRGTLSALYLLGMDLWHEQGDKEQALRAYVSYAGIVADEALWEYPWRPLFKARREMSYLMLQEVPELDIAEEQAFFEAALELSRELDSVWGEANALAQLSLLAQEAEDIEASLTYAQTREHLLAEESTPELVAYLEAQPWLKLEALQEIALLQRVQGHDDRETLRAIIDTFATLSKPLQQERAAALSDAMSELGHTLLLEGETEEARDILLEVLEQPEDTFDAFTVRNQLAWIYRSLRQEEKAVELYTTMAHDAMLEQRLSEAAHTLMHKGHAQSDLRDYYGAISSYKASVRLATQVEHPYYQQWSNLWLALTYLIVDDEAQAKAHLNLADEASQEIILNFSSVDTDLPYALAEAYVRVGEYKRARRVLERNLSARLATGTTALNAAYLDLLTNVLLHLGDFEDAHESGTYALAGWEDLADEERVLSAQIRLAAVAALATSPELADAEALDTLLILLTEAREANSVTALANAYYYLGQSYDQRGAEVFALQNLRAALNVHRTMGYFSGDSDVNEQRTEALIDTLQAAPVFTSLDESEEDPAGILKLFEGLWQ